MFSFCNEGPSEKGRKSISLSEGGKHLSQKQFKAAAGLLSLLAFHHRVGLFLVKKINPFSPNYDWLVFTKLEPEFSVLRCPCVLRDRSVTGKLQSQNWAKAYE